MIEKLLENWLDSASERSYQAVFVQLLAAEGYSVLHSTRHCTLEYGKDILAIAPDGVGCAFQLKGDPRGRMNVSTFRSEIQGQLLQLASQTPQYPGFPADVHRSYLVSNGQFDEEVQVAVSQMNAGYIPSKIALWSRGTLFDLAKKHAANLWPSELEGNRALLELYLSNPRASLPLQTLSSVLESILHLRPGDEPLRPPAFDRAVTSAAWITGIGTSTFAEAENHHALAQGWTLCVATLTSAALRYDIKKSKTFQATLRLAEDALLDALVALWEDFRLREGKVMQGDKLTDSLLYGWRLTVLYALLTPLVIANGSRNVLADDSRDALTEWLRAARTHVTLWGEGAIVNLTAWLIWLRTVDATQRPDREIEAAVSAVINRNQPDCPAPLVNPYYGFEEIVRHQIRVPPVHKLSSLDQESLAGNAHTAEPLMHLLVRTNNKTACRIAWPGFTKLCHRSVLLDDEWQFGLLRASNAVEQNKIYPSTYEWKQLKRDALTEDSNPKVPQYFRDRPWMLAMWWHVCPQRMDINSLRIFVDHLCPGWGS